MKCKMCKENEAVIHLRSMKLSICEECYKTFFERQIKRGIEEYKMFKKSDKIGVCVSGGKDGNVLLSVLKKMGYNVIGIHINLGIKEYSKFCEKNVKNLCKDINVTLKIIDLKKIIGLSLDEVLKKIGKVRKPCSTCSLIKRYLFNKTAVDMNLDVLATGHNMDDEIAFVFSNILRWDLASLSRNRVVLERKKGFVKKVKPLFRLSDNHVKIYADFSGISYIEKKCPYEKRANSLFYKKVWEIMEKEKPGIKSSFYFTFLKKIDQFDTFSEDVKLKSCKICGFPTTRDICSFCKLMEKLKS